MNKEEIEELKRLVSGHGEYSLVESDHVLWLLSHIESLEAKLEIAREALKTITVECSGGFVRNERQEDIEIARKALAKLKEGEE